MLVFVTGFNPFSANPTKWSNILKQFVGFYRRIVLVCLTILYSFQLKGYFIEKNKVTL